MTLEAFVMGSVTDASEDEVEGARASRVANPSFVQMLTILEKSGVPAGGVVPPATAPEGGVDSALIWAMKSAIDNTPRPSFSRSASSRAYTLFVFSNGPPRFGCTVPTRSAGVNIW